MGSYIASTTANDCRMLGGVTSQGSARCRIHRISSYHATRYVVRPQINGRIVFLDRDTSLDWRSPLLPVEGQYYRTDSKSATGTVSMVYSSSSLSPYEMVFYCLLFSQNQIIQVRQVTLARPSAMDDETASQARHSTDTEPTLPPERGKSPMGQGANG